MLSAEGSGSARGHSRKNSSTSEPFGIYKRMLLHAFFSGPGRRALRRCWSEILLGLLTGIDAEHEWGSTEENIPLRAMRPPNDSNASELGSRARFCPNATTEKMTAHDGSTESMIGKEMAKGAAW